MRTLALTAFAMTLTACATPHETQPARTATEQLLVSHAAEQAAGQLQLGLAPGTRVYVVETYVLGDGSTYAIGAARAALSAQGLALTDERASAAAIVELRLGALSIDQVDRVLGLPSMTIPTGRGGLTPSTISTPELSLYSTHERKGVAEISAFAYDAHTGAPLGAAAIGAGSSLIKSRKLVTAIGWGVVQEKPGKK